MMNLVPDRFALGVWPTGYIDVLIHTDIFLKNWEVLQDVIINHVWGFALLIGLWCSGIAFRDQPYLYHWNCIVSSSYPLVVWGSVIHLP